MSTTFNRIQKTTLRAQISSQLRDAIVEGRLKPGQRLLERSLAEEFGTSLTSMREALIELEGQGFLSKEPGNGTCVTNLTAQQVDELLEMRGALEGLAAEKCASEATEAELEELESLFAQRIELIRKGDLAGFMQLDLQWHEMIWRCAHNGLVEKELHSVAQRFFAFCAIRLVHHPGYNAEADAMMERPIMDAISARDGSAAREALLAASRAWRRTAADLLSTDHEPQRTTRI